MNNEPNIADLLRTLRDDTATLVRQELALARAELAEKLSLAGRNLVYLAAGGAVAASSLLLVLLALGSLLGQWISSRGVSPGLAAFFGLAIVAIIAGVVGAVLISKGLKTLLGTSLKPERTLRSLEEDKQWAQQKIS